MSLKSELFKDNHRLQDCLIKDSAHIMLGAQGEHVGKIQQALIIMDKSLNIDDEFKQQYYGHKTAQAVQNYKENHNPPIINRSYQSQADNIVGKMTIQALDDDLLKLEKDNGEDNIITLPRMVIVAEPNEPAEWFVTSFSGNSESIVVTLGYNAFTGFITFKSPMKNKEIVSPIGLFGISVGSSVNVPVNIPTTLTKYLPKGWLEKMSNNTILVDILKKATSKLPEKLKAPLTKVASSVSVGYSSLPSKAIGIVYPNNRTELEPIDFHGTCVCISLIGAAYVGNGGVYLLFFGMSVDSLKILNHLTITGNFDLFGFLEKNSKGVAIISAAGVSIELNLGASLNVSAGQIV